MSFTDRLRAWFKGETKRSAPNASTDRASRSSTKELEAFIDSRQGVEAFLEPKTAVYSTTLLLVAGDGEYLRRPIRDQRQATELCNGHNVPLYDARKVGYPRRMKDYDRGERPREVSLDDLPPWPGDTPGGAPGDSSGDPPGGSPGGPPPPPEGGPPPPPPERG